MTHINPTARIITRSLLRSSRLSRARPQPSTLALIRPSPQLPLASVTRSFASSSRWRFEGKPGVRETSEKGKEVAAEEYQTSSLTPEEYNHQSSHTMDTLHDSLEALVEEWSPEGSNGWEVEYSSGVLTLSLGPHGTYVINKQPPNKEIWLSSPFSGPARYAYSSPSTSSPSEFGTWFYSRDNTTIGGLLDREIRSVLVAEVGKEGEDWEGVGVN